MATAASTALRISRHGLDPIRERYAMSADREIDPYALDPFAFIALLSVPDVETKRPVPFVLYDHQREVVDAYVDLAELGRESLAYALDARPRFRNLHVDKTRQMGDTWLFCAIDLWVLSYWPVAALVTHLKQKKVDDGGSRSTVESYMGKIRYLWRTLPPEHRGPLDFTHLLIRNVATGGYLLGEGANSEPGRGGTYDKVTVDEAARLPYGRAAQNALVQACPNGRAMLSTPWGEDPVFFATKKRKPKSFTFFTHHWSRHPFYSIGLHVAGAESETCARCRNTVAGVRWDPTEILSHRYPGKKTSPWYDAANAEYEDDADVAQELDIDYSASLPARVYPEFSEPTHVWTTDQIMERFGRPLLFDPKYPPETAWDYGADTNSILILQDMPDSLRVCGEYEIGDSLPEDVVAGVLEVCADLGVPLDQLLVHRTRRWFSVGDVAGESRQQATGRPLVTDYRNAGIRIQARGAKIVPTIRAVKRILFGRPKPMVVDGDRCPLFVAHFKGNRYPTDAAGRRKLNAHEPLNDEHNHMMRAFAYYCHFKYPPPKDKGAPDRDDERPVVSLPSARLNADPIRYGEGF